MTNVEWEFIAVVGSDLLSVRVDTSGPFIHNIVMCLELGRRNDSRTTKHTCELVKDNNHRAMIA